MQIIVTAMHRSGSSLCTRLLSFMGIHLGPGNALLPPRPDNPKGFWERSDLQILHDQVLEKLNCSWYDIAEFDLKAADEKLFDFFKIGAEKILRELDTWRPWVLKDPRICLFFPWWRQLLEVPIIIYVYRSPLQVAKSLQKRNNLPLCVGLALWEAYNIRALDAGRGLPRTFVSFARMVDEPMATLARIFSDLQKFEVSGIRPVSEKEVNAFLNYDLLHHQDSSDEEYTFLTQSQKRLWHFLEDGAPMGRCCGLSVSKLAEDTLRHYCNKDREISGLTLRLEENEGVNEALNAEKEQRMKENELLWIEQEDQRKEIEELHTKQQKEIENIHMEKQVLLGEIQALGSSLADAKLELKASGEELKASGEELSEKEGTLNAQRDHGDSLQAEIQTVRRMLDRHIAGPLSLPDAVDQFERQYQEARDLAQSNYLAHQQSEKALQEVYVSRTWRWGRKLFGPPASVCRICKRIVTRPWIRGGDPDRQAAPVIQPTDTQRLPGPGSLENALSVPGAANSTEAPLSQLFSMFHPHPKFPELDTREIVDIIIPVYNGYPLLFPLFKSIFENTTIPYRLIIVNDASTEGKVTAYLESLAQKNDAIRLIVNEENLGFVRSINRAAKIATHDFVILNSDVTVPPHWLERLMRPIRKLPNVASATPFTNSGTICSFPDFPNDSELFAGLTADEIDGAFARVKPDACYFPLPTGVGFCMAINKTVWDKIGPFDAEAFGDGYGEENDWCLRAQAHEFTNVMVPNLFVYHKHGGSFSDRRKKEQLKKNMPRIHERYPSYGAQVEKFVSRDPARDIRKWVMVLLSACRSARKVVLIVDHQLGGGANLYRRKLVRDRSGHFESFLILSYDVKNGRYRIKYIHDTMAPVLVYLKYPGELMGLVDYLPVHEIIINNMVSYPDPLAMLGVLHRIKNTQQARMIFCAHDFFAICPSCNLLDENGTYCEVSDLTNCQTCISQNKQVLEHYRQSDMRRWRQTWQNILDNCDEILCFSKSSLDIFSQVYPQTDSGKFVIRPHQVSDMRLVLFDRHGKKNIRTIGVIGFLALHKGSRIVFQINKRIAVRNLGIRIVVIGDLPEHPEKYTGSRDGIIVTGPYRRDNLPAIVETYGVDMVLLPSIWPETFSYVTEECIRMGLPVAVFDLGAPAERVRLYDKGIVIDKIDPDVALEQIMAYLAVPEPEARTR